MSDRPFKVLGIQQIAVSGLDKNRLRTLWVDTLGLELSGTYQSALAPENHGAFNGKSSGKSFDFSCVFKDTGNIL